MSQWGLLLTFMNLHALLGKKDSGGTKNFFVSFVNPIPIAIGTIGSLCSSCPFFQVTKSTNLPAGRENTMNTK
jgi:hypothetical protein